MKNTIDLHYLRSIKALVNLQGRDYLTHPGLLRVAHEHGLKSIHSDLISWDPEKKAAVIRTVVEGERGTFVSYGDACPANVAKHLAEATLRMAETRAVNRALRLYTGLGMTTTEELPGASEDPPEVEAPSIPEALQDVRPPPPKAESEEVDADHFRRYWFARLKELAPEIQDFQRHNAQAYLFGQAHLKELTPAELQRAYKRLRATPDPRLQELVSQHLVPF